MDKKISSTKIISAFLTLTLLAIIIISGPNETIADGVFGGLSFGYGYGYGGGYPAGICVKHRNVSIGKDANPPGVNPFKYRTGSYAFTGEQIEFTIVVRDPNGAIDIGFPKISVDNQPKVLCNEIPLTSISDYSCDGFGMLNPETDKAYHCLLTVGPWYGEKEVKITAYDSSFQPSDSTHKETWFFNPQLSYTITTSDGQPLRFEEMPYGADTPDERTVHSVNRLVVKNTAEGGVNMWTFIAGTDFYDPNGASKCPTSNVLKVEYMKYRGWSGTQWTSWEGWETMSRYDQNDLCVVTPFAATSHCYGGKPVPYPNTNDDIPDPMEYVLTNQGRLEVEFKLTYPMPCVGSFTEGSILIFGKPV
ncbi:MAG: hypothetical protein QXY45_00840 [Candidatus Aenigmatarchaeota archaeon]